jgi:hypothetical protein
MAIAEEWSSRSSSPRTSVDGSIAERISGELIPEATTQLTPGGLLKEGTPRHGRGTSSMTVISGSPQRRFTLWSRSLTPIGHSLTGYPMDKENKFRELNEKARRVLVNLHSWGGAPLSNEDALGNTQLDIEEYRRAAADSS